MSLHSHSFYLQQQTQALNQLSLNRSIFQDPTLLNEKPRYYEHTASGYSNQELDLPPGHVALIDDLPKAAEADTEQPEAASSPNKEQEAQPRLASPKLLQLLNLQSFDVLYRNGSTFEDMIIKAFLKKKDFYLAKVCVRGFDAFDQDSPSVDPFLGGGEPAKEDDEKSPKKKSMISKFLGHFSSKEPTADPESEHSVLKKHVLSFREKEGENRIYFFNALSILKYLVKKRRNELIGRFHPEAYHQAYIPQLKKRVMGEVEFYRIENPFKHLAEEQISAVLKHGPSLKKKASPLRSVKKAFFIGTDYDFSFNADLRLQIMDACMEQDLRLLDFPEAFPMDPAIETLLNQSYDSVLQRRDESDLMRQVERNFEGNSTILNTIYLKFLNTSHFFYFGVITSWYRVCSFVCFFLSFNQLLRMSVQSNIISLNEYSLLLPFLMLAYDAQLPKIKGRKERTKDFRKKVVLLSLFLVLISTTYVLFQADDNKGEPPAEESPSEPEDESRKPSDISYLSNFDQISTNKESLTGVTKLVVLLANFTVMVFPLLSYVYSWSLFEKQSMSERLNRQELQRVRLAKFLSEMDEASQTRIFNEILDNAANRTHRSLFQMGDISSVEPSLSSSYASGPPRRSDFSLDSSHGIPDQMAVVIADIPAQIENVDVIDFSIPSEFVARDINSPVGPYRGNEGFMAAGVPRYHEAFVDVQSNGGPQPIQLANDSPEPPVSSRASDIENIQASADREGDVTDEIGRNLPQVQPRLFYFRQQDNDQS